MSRRHTPFVLASSAVLALGGCGILAPDEPSTDQSSSSSTTPTDADVVDAPQEQQLSVDEAEAALPGISVVPDGYRKTKGKTTEAKPDAEPKQVDPQKCAALFFGSKGTAQFAHDHRAVGTFVSYGLPRRSSRFGEVSITVMSYDEPYPLEYFDRAGAAMSKCQKFTVDGDVKILTNPIAVPLMGDRTFGVRIEYPDTGESVDYLYVRSGHNFVRVMNLTASSEEYDNTLMSKLARTTLDNLESD